MWKSKIDRPAVPDPMQAEIEQLQAEHEQALARYARLVDELTVMVDEALAESRSTASDAPRDQ